MKFRIMALAAVVTMMSTIAVMAQSGGKLPPIKSKEYTMKNGLRVIFHQDRSTPVVTVGVWYHVGAKNEEVGRTGFAHLFEHMMFQGSANYDADYFTPLQEAGASVNGTTNQDRTWYYQTVPSNFLELALYMEADRLGNLLPAMTQEKLDNQRDVVKNERRQRVDNQPYGTSFERIGEIMYPKPHPYNWSTIGSLEDLQAASMDDVKSFFRRYYVPNNAILILSGDFDEKNARRMIDKHFGQIKSGGDISRPDPAQPKLEKEIRTTVEDTVPLARKYMVWHGVREYAPDQPALDFLSSILSSGRTSRLQSNLLFKKELVAQVSASNSTNEIAGLFQIAATARPGKSLDEVEKEIVAEIEKIKQQPPTADEMTRALNSIESQTIFGLQTTLGKAGQMATSAGYLGRANWFQQDIDRYRKVTPADVSRVANTYLTNNRLVMSYVPRAGAAPAAARQADQTTSVKKEAADEKRVAAQTAALPKAGPDPKLSLPSIEKTKLSNGMELWMVEQRELPIMSMNLVFKTGSSNEPSDRLGVASLTSSLMTTGTKTRSAEDIANQLRQIGVNNIGSGSSWDATNVSIQMLSRHVDQALAIFSDVVQNPSFPVTELESLRGRLLVGLRQQKANPNAISNVVFNKVLYGDHPYGRDNNETTVRAITRDDIVKYYDATYRPNNAVLIVVGDFKKGDIKAKAEKAFAEWKPANVSGSSIPAPPARDKAAIYIVDRPNSAQSVVSIGQVGIDRSNPDYFPLMVMNSVLGGQFVSRINLNLREEKGYTYGAGSGFTTRRSAGPFTAGGDIQTAVTKEAIVELMKELNEIRSERPITQRELEYNKQGMIRRYPAGFETNGAISNQLANLITYNLPESYFNDYISKVNSVTLADVNRVAKQYLDPSKMAIVIVGDRKVIEPGLRGLGFEIRFLDADGNPIVE